MFEFGLVCKLIVHHMTIIFCSVKKKLITGSKKGKAGKVIEVVR